MSWVVFLAEAPRRSPPIETKVVSVPAVSGPSNEGKGLTGNTTAKTPLKTSGGVGLNYRDYRIGFSGTDLISPTQFEYYSELKYRMPQALDHALYRLEEVQGEINDMELSEEVRRIARKRRHILNGWIIYYREQLQ